jgi:hypothetical protein
MSATGRRAARTALMVALSWGFAWGAAGQGGGGEVGGGGGDAAAGAYRVCIPRVEASPVVDGALGPGEWQGAARLDGFIQVEPDEGRPATEATQVFLARDSRALYVAFVAKDSRMSSVRAVHMPRDRWTMSDDAVAIVVDPFQSRTRAFVFQANPLGVQSDGIWSRQWDWSWDGVFGSRGAVYDGYYVVEMAIPLSTLLGARSGGEAWDVNFTRWVARKNERSWWAPLKRDELNALLTRFGSACGMGEDEARTRMEVIPTLTGRAGGTPGAGRDDGLSEGVTVRMPARTWLRAEGTFRPDFSFVESDVPQIAFNERYALFYPEKRPFFLESQDQFDVPVASFDSGPLQLLHTRTIARPVLGARVLASPGDFFIGGLVATQDRLDGSADGSSVVLRGMRRWRSSSQVGVMTTRRQYENGGDNLVLSGDAQIRLPASALLTVQAARSVSSDSVGARREATALYLDLAREGSATFQQVVFRRVPTDFEAGMGFVPRNDVQQTVGHVGVYWRPRGLPLLYALPMYQIVTSWDDAGRRVDIEHLPHVELMFLRATKVFLAYRFGDELFRERFHRSARTELRLSTAPAWWLDVSLEGKAGGRIRYDHGDGPDHTFVGSYRVVGGGLDLKVGKGGEISGLLSRASFGASEAMPARSLLLWRLRATLYLDNQRYLRVVSQQDPDTDQRLDSFIFGWELNYGTQLHVGLERGVGAGAAVAGRDFTMFVRLSYLLRV